MSTNADALPAVRASQVILRQSHCGQATDVWAAGVLLWALAGGGFAFLRPDEESLDRPGRMRVMAPRIVSGAYRQLHQVQTFQFLHDLLHARWASLPAHIASRCRCRSTHSRTGATTSCPPLRWTTRPLIERRPPCSTGLNLRRQQLPCQQRLFHALLLPLVLNAKS